MARLQKLSTSRSKTRQAHPHERHAAKIYQHITRHCDDWFIPGAEPGELADILGDLRPACVAEGPAMEEIELSSMGSPKGSDHFLMVLAHPRIQRVVTIGGSNLKTIKSIAEAYIK